MQEEIWKPIVIEQNGVVYDYSGLYEVSNHGRIRSLGRTVMKLNNGTLCAVNYKGKILKLGKKRKGYVFVGLHKDGKTKNFYVHRCVAYAFIPNDDPKNKTQINHKDENPSNNHVDNLEWCTCQYNNNYGSHKEAAAYANAKKVICLETGKVYPSQAEAAREIGFDVSCISKCCKNINKTHNGYHWRYYTDYILEINERNEKLVA